MQKQLLFTRTFTSSSLKIVVVKVKKGLTMVNPFFIMKNFKVVSFSFLHLGDPKTCPPQQLLRMQILEL